MAEINYEYYEYFNNLAPGSGFWHSFGPGTVWSTGGFAPLAISMTAVPFPYLHDYAVLKVEDIHITKFKGSPPREYFGANVWNPGPLAVWHYRIGVGFIGLGTPSADVAAPGVPSKIEEALRVTAIHDGAGQISSLIVRSAESWPAHLEMRWDQRATEIDVPGLTRELDPAQMFELLSDLAENHQVEAPGATGVLKRKYKA